MKWTKKMIVLAGLLASGKNAAAAVITAAAAGITASQLGHDPLPWVIGAAGSTVVYAYRKPATRAHALANGMVCVFLGGVGAPWAGTLVAFYFGQMWANEYMLAGALSVAWPWATPVIWTRAVAMFKALTSPAGGNDAA